MNARRFWAIAAIVFLVALYVCDIVLAFIKSAFATKMLQLSIVLTVAIPIITYFIMMFYKINHRDDEK